MGDSFLTELKRRKVVRVGLVYGAVVFAVVQAADVFVPALALPEWIVTAVALVSLLGLPVALVLAWAFEVAPEGVRRTPVATGGGVFRGWVGLRTFTVVALLLVIGFGLGMGWFADGLNLPAGPVATGAPTGPVRFTFDLPDETRLLRAPALALSPDGRIIAFAAERNDTSRIYVRRLSDEKIRPIPGTERGRAPAFSADGMSIVYLRDNDVLRVAVSGERAPVRIARMEGTPHAVAVGPDGRMAVTRIGARSFGELVDLGDDGAAVDVPADGVFRVVRFAASNRLLLTRYDGSCASAQLVALDMDTKDQRWLMDGARSGVFAAGHIVYVSEGAVLAGRFDEEAMQWRSDPQVLVRGASMEGCAAAHLDVSANGVLAFAPASTNGAPPRLVAVGRDGSSEVILEIEGRIVGPRLSPDGSRVAFWMTQGSTTDVWVYDLRRGALGRVTTRGRSFWPVWLPDGRSLLFPHDSTGGAGPVRVSLAPADGSAPPRPVIPASSARGFSNQPYSVSPDGKVLAFHQHTERDIDIYRLDLGSPAEPVPLLWSSAHESHPAISPDGRWLAYQSDESGQLQVYVTTFPDAGPRWVVSAGEGFEPGWSPSSNELFYRSGDRLMAVTYRAAGGFDPGPPREVVQGIADDPNRVGRGWDVSPDGERFVFFRGENDRPTSITVVLGWTALVDESSPASR